MRAPNQRGLKSGWKLVLLVAAIVAGAVGMESCGKGGGSAAGGTTFYGAGS